MSLKAPQMQREDVAAEAAEAAAASAASAADAAAEQSEG